MFPVFPCAPARVAAVAAVVAAVSPTAWAVSPFVLGQAVATFEGRSMGIVLKGIDPASEFRVNELNVPGAGTCTTDQNGQFTIDIEGLSLANFAPNTSQAFPILSATTISGFDSNTFAFVTGGSLGSTPGYASWSIEQQGNSLWLNYTAAVPEPTVVALLGLGGLLLFVGRRLRRR